MNKKIILPAFIIMVLAQWYVPGSMIFNREKVLSDGKEFRFKAAPVDPYDPFRGKYIVLSFEENAAQVTDVSDWTYGDPVYVSLVEDENGFAKIQSISNEEPVGASDYVLASINFFMEDSLSNVVIDYPFNRFYMEESKAYDAEHAYNESLRDTSGVTFAIVSIKNGDAVIKDVFINGIPIKEAARIRNENQN